MKLTTGLRYLLVVLICTHSVYAQSKYTGNIFDYGKKRFYGSIGFAGVASQVDGDAFGGFNKLGMAAGPSVYAQLHKNWVLMMGIWYTQKGSRNGKATGSDLGTYIEKYKLNLHYFDVPVLINYVYKEGYLFGAGLSYNAFFRAQEEIISYTGTTVYDDPRYKFNRHSVEFVCNAAAMANKNLMLFMRYHYGLSSIRSYRNTVTGVGNQFNNYFTFGLEYLF